MQYTPDVQKLFLEFMLQDASLYTRVSNIFNPDNFDKKVKRAAEFIDEHAKQHNTLPDRTQIKAVAGVDFMPIDGINDGHISWFLEEFEKFTRRQELERAILKAADLLEKGEYDPVEKLIKDAVHISLTKDMGTDYYADPRSRLLRLKSSNGQISTGWAQLDHAIYGGFNRKELEIVSGASGSGKSLVLQNLACNWSLAKLNGVYVTLELSEDLCAMRIDSMLTHISSRELFKDLDQVELKVRMLGRQSGHLKIKYMPAQSTVNDIRAYVKELQIREGIVLDYICVDYLDLMTPVGVKVNPSDTFVKDKHVSEELRNLAHELNVVLMTASQLNRCLSLDTLVVANGKTIEIRYVKVGDWLESECGPVKVTEVLPITKQPVFEIVLKSGKKIRASANHKFPTKDGLKTINSSLTIGDKLKSRSNGVIDWYQIVSIDYVGVEETIDINVTNDRLFFANDILTHNSAVEEVEFDHSHISGGISKIFTADNVMGIFTSRAMRERGKYQLQLMKTRNSSGVNKKIDLDFDVNCLRITDNGEQSQEPQTDKITQMMSQIKTGSRVTNRSAAEDQVGRVATADVQSSKLKSMLAQLKKNNE